MYSIYSKKLDGWAIPIRKISMLMRFTAIAILIAAMQASAAGYAQSITLSKKDATLMEVFQELRRQTDYDFVYSRKQLANSRTISIDVRNVDITDVLDLCFQNQPLIYNIENKTITIKEKPLSFIDKVIRTFTKQTINGKVISASNQEPLPGAIIKVTNTNDQTRSNQTLVTNDRGEFTLALPDDTYNLSVHYLSYKARTLTIQIPLQTPLIISLDTDEQTLQEVEINAGYYTVKDRERTGSISRVSSETIAKQPVNNVLQALQGRIPGVDIVQSTGVPGGGFTIRVRGQNSISQGNEPLYIIDGVSFSSTALESSKGIGIVYNASPLSTINPSDIESIEILKDADATAIYGSRGANGVVLIQTKRGSTGDTRASVNVMQSLSRVEKQLELMTTDQYLEMRNEAFSNDKVNPSATQFDVNGSWRSDKYTNWQKELIGGIAPSSNLQASLSGGNSVFTYLLGTARYKEQTVFPGKNSFGRNSGNINSTYSSLNRRLNATFSANYSQSNSNLFTQDMTAYILLPPNFPNLLDEKGELNWENNTIYVNPYGQQLRSYDSSLNNLVTNALVTYTLFPGFKIKGSVGYTTLNRKDYTSEPLFTTSPVFNNGPDQRAAYFANAGISTWIIEPQMSYDKTFGKGKLNILLGTSFQESITDGQEVKGSGYTSDALLGNIASASLLTVPQRQYLQYRYTSVFGRLNYNLLDKYIFNLTGRRDGSSRFGTANRFANFGAIGAAWIFSNESFIKNALPFVSFGKIRGSYGITGNDQISDYGYLELWNTFTNTYQGTATIVPHQISNPDYAWEVNNKFELAIDISFKNRINLSAAFYSNQSSSQLVGRQLPPSTGYLSVQENLPATVRNSGLEFEIHTKNISGKTLNWTTSFNLTLPKNILLRYPNLSSSNDAIFYEVGHALSILKTYQTSIDTQTGLYIFEDYDKNGLINDDDRSQIQFRGKHYFGGVQNVFRFKDLELDFLVQFIKQNGKSLYASIANNPGRFLPGSPFTNQPVEVLDRWRNTGDQTSFQKFSTAAAATTSYNTARNFGSFAVGDASFIRLKNISLSYTVPSNLVKKLKISTAKIYLQGQNLLTISGYKGLDPETQSLTTLPALQVFSIGLQCTF